ncbi:MAG: hypothetical protein QOE70_364 [Chthoniobacter sp.]|jgi:predicted PurR-regulated permease PerM|nr:hypothetical protein [Chthoniobacter sp.]
MNNDTPSPASSLHLPFALLALAVAVLLASQVGASKQSATIMKWQSDTLAKQITNMQVLDKQLAEAIKNRESHEVKQSAELQGQLQNLLNDLLDLAKDDPDAQKIVQKWNIARSTPPAGTPAPGEDKKAP